MSPEIAAELSRLCKKEKGVCFFVVAFTSMVKTMVSSDTFGRVQSVALLSLPLLSSNQGVSQLPSMLTPDSTLHDPYQT